MDVYIPITQAGLESSMKEKISAKPFTHMMSNEFKEENESGNKVNH